MLTTPILETTSGVAYVSLTLAMCDRLIFNRVTVT